MSDSVVLNSSLVLGLEKLCDLKVCGQRLAVDLHGSARLDGNALERAMIAFNRAMDQLESVVMGAPHTEASPEIQGASALVELATGEALLVGNPLSEAIESTARTLDSAKGQVREVLFVQLNGLLAEQRSQLFTSPPPTRDQIGTV
ncbi:hypothetical protein ACSMEV_15490 [Pseudomonas sp. MLB6B]